MLYSTLMFPTTNAGPCCILSPMNHEVFNTVVGDKHYSGTRHHYPWLVRVFPLPAHTAAWLLRWLLERSHLQISRLRTMYMSHLSSILVIDFSLWTLYFVTLLHRDHGALTEFSFPALVPGNSQVWTFKET